MKPFRILVVGALAAALALPSAAIGAAEKKGEKKPSKGAELFQKHCAACHPDGGNIIKPDHTLMKKSREAHGVKTAKDIVGKMRKPDPGMTAFDEKTLPEPDAKAIADYIIKTFK